MIKNMIFSYLNDNKNEERDEIDGNFDFELIAMFDDNWKNNVNDEHTNKNDEIEKHLDDNNFMTNELIEREIIIDNFQRLKV
jgi:hypothetical protein